MVNTEIPLMKGEQIKPVYREKSAYLVGGTQPVQIYQHRQSGAVQYMRRRPITRMGNL
jgi:hypothetical protein